MSCNHLDDCVRYDLEKQVEALQQAIELYCEGEIIPESIVEQCPQHATMLNYKLAKRPVKETEMNEADKSILKFPVLWQGGGDAEGWIVERPDGTRYVRMTHRGIPYEAPLQSLIERMDEYGRVWAATFEAMTVLQGKNIKEHDHD